jgi:hypothetical protein
LNAVLTITTTSLPAGILGVPYDSFVNAAGAPAPFTWAVISGSLPPGLTFLTTSTSTSAEITGTPTVLGTSNFTVQVTDSSDASVTQALSITVNRPPPLSVATGSLQDGTVNTAYSQTLQASSGTQPYTWSITTGALPVGLTLNSSNGVIFGKPIATGTYDFTVQVIDSSKPTPQIATANLSITITQGSTVNSRLSGYYAFSVRGFDTNGLFVAAGSFSADGMGNISTGIMDTNTTKSLLPNQTFNGTYSIGQNGLGYMTFNILTVGTGSRSFALSMMANGNANIIEFDDTTGGFVGNSARNSGVLLKQTTSTAFTPGNDYAFGFLGIDSNKNRFGVAGDFQAAGTPTSGTLSGLLDSDDGGSLSTGATITGTYNYTATPNGRGLATIGNSTYSFYVVSPTELLVVEIDPFVPGGTNPLVGGTILQQSCSACFSSGSFNNPSVFEVTGLDASTAQGQVGQFYGVGGSFSLTSDQNSGGTLTTLQGTGSYTVAPNGRVTLSGSGFQNSLPVLYLVTTNQAFIIGTDAAVSFGFMTPQSGVPFSTASLSGTYAGGSLAPVDSAVSNVVSIDVAGSNNLSVTEDISNDNGLSSPPPPSESTTVPDAQGRVVVTENGNTTEVLYLVSPTEFFALDALSTDPTARVDIFQQ